VEGRSDGISDSMSESASVISDNNPRKAERGSITLRTTKPLDTNGMMNVESLQEGRALAYLFGMGQASKKQDECGDLELHGKQLLVGQPFTFSVREL
jgi:hypothetical protein